MKKAQANLKKAIVLFFAAAMTVSVSKANNEILTSNEVKAKVNYIGSTEDGVVFNLAFANEEGKSFSVKILDAEGEVLYLNSYKDKNFKKKFIAPKEVVNGLTFVITADKKEYRESFNVQQRWVEEVVASRN